MKSAIYSYPLARYLAALTLTLGWIAPICAQPASPSSATGTNAGTATGSRPGKEATDVGSSVSGSDYLDRQIAARDFTALRSMLRTDVFRLNRMVNNFGKEVPGSDKSFNDVKESYRYGMELYYRRRLVEAYQTLKKGRDQAQDLYKRFSELYQQQSMKILKECSESMVDVELSDIKPDEKAPVDSDDLKRNQVRLQIAYNQIAQAEEMTRNNRYDTAVEHYRLAKIFAVGILKDMQITDEGKKAVDEKYKTDMIDALGHQQTVPGRSSTGKSSSAPAPAATSP